MTFSNTYLYLPQGFQKYLAFKYYAGRYLYVALNTQHKIDIYLHCGYI